MRTLLAWTAQNARRLQAGLRDAFFKDVPLKLVSLVIAVMLWTVVAGAKEVRLDVEVDLVYAMPGDKVLETDPRTKVIVSAEGPATQIALWRADRLRLPVDLSEAPEGRTVITLDAAAVPRPPGIRIVRVQPAQITVTFARKAVWSASVVPEFAGDDDFEPEAVVMYPSQVSVTGPARDRERVREVRTTTVTLRPRPGPFRAVAPLVRPVRAGFSIEPGEVRIEGELRPRTAVRTMEVEVIVRGVGARPFDVTPGAVRVRLQGPAAFVRGIAPEAVHAVAEMPPASIETGEATDVEVRASVDGAPPGLRASVDPPAVRVVPRAPAAEGGRRDRRRGAP